MITENSACVSRGVGLGEFLSSSIEPPRVAYRGVDPEQALQAAWAYETLTIDTPPGSLFMRSDTASRCRLDPGSRALRDVVFIDFPDAIAQSADVIEVFDDLCAPTRAASREARKALRDLVGTATQCSPPWPLWKQKDGSRPVFVASGLENGGLSEASVTRIVRALNARLVSGKDAVWEAWIESSTAAFVATDNPIVLRLALARGVPCRAACGPDPTFGEWAFSLSGVGGVKRAWLPLSDPIPRPNVVKMCQCGSHKECHVRSFSTAPCGELDEKTLFGVVNFLSKTTQT